MLIRGHPVRHFMVAQLFCIILFAGGISLFFGKIGGISTLFGGGVAMMNVIGTAFAWPRLLEKKDVALALSIIVSKFALSIGIFYWLTLPPDGRVSIGRVFGGVWFGDQTYSVASASGTLIAFAIGLSSVVPAALIVALFDLTKKRDLKT